MGAGYDRVGPGRLPAPGRRHELLDGEHNVTPTPLARHQRIGGRLYLALGGHVQATLAGEIFYAPFDVILSDHDVVVPARNVV
jgi:hypothetical protein